MVLKQYAPVPVPLSEIRPDKPVEAFTELNKVLIDEGKDEIGLIHWPLIAQVLDG